MSLIIGQNFGARNFDWYETLRKAIGFSVLWCLGVSDPDAAGSRWPVFSPTTRR